MAKERVVPAVLQGVINTRVAIRRHERTAEVPRILQQLGQGRDQVKEPVELFDQK